MKVQVIGVTQFLPPSDISWSTDAEGGQALAEFAGRACYQSWSKPNPATATNEGYINHIIEVGHFSVLEHAQVSMYIEGISRSLTHELIRHRHFSYSQLSQRYVVDKGKVVVPDVIKDDPELYEQFLYGIGEAQGAYEALYDTLYHKTYANVESKTMRRKLARQAARSVLPNATETKIVVTGNIRAWRHFLHLRANIHADLEIRELAVATFGELRKHVPNFFQDCSYVNDTDDLWSVKVGSPEEA